MRALPGQHLKPRYYVPIEDQLNVIFRDLLFQPLLAIVADYNAQLHSGGAQLFNAATDALQLALRSGKIQYEAGVFTGKFNAAISRTLDAIGARYDARSGVYRLAPIEVPAWVKGEAASYQQTAKGAHQMLMRTLNDTQADLDRLLDKVDVYAGRTVREIQKDMKSVVEGITVLPTLSEDAIAKLSVDYNQNMKIYIKKFSKRMIGSLRDTVEKNAQQGYRFDSLIDGIQSKYSVSKNKAKFLARQETALFMSKFREQRYGDAGFKRYRWRTSEDARVRPTASTRGVARLDNHRELNGRIFEYAHPPVVDKRTNRRANPGQDFNCFPANASVEIACGVKKAFRRWYSGELAFIILESGETLRATPNHPVLTLDGWKPMERINQSDQIIQLSDDLRGTIKLDHKKGVATIGQIFKSIGKSTLRETFPGEPAQFHGDGTHRNIDVVGTARPLWVGRKSGLDDLFDHLALASADRLASRKGGLLHDFLTLPCRYRFGGGVRSSGKRASFLKGHAGHANNVGLGPTPDGNLTLVQAKPDNVSANLQTLRDGKLALSRDVGLTDRPSIHLDSVFQVRSVLGVGREWFRGHVFNLQTKNSWYTSAGVIVHNCRCIDEPVLDAL